MARQDNSVDEATACARELLGGGTVEKIEVFDSTPAGHATSSYSINLGLGWCERIIASDMYDHDARGIAYALAAVLNCSQVVFPDEFKVPA